MYIQRKDIEKITGLMDKFPNAHTYQLKTKNTSAIGTEMYLIITDNFNGVFGDLKVEVSGVDNW
jgi:hypothetical protein